MDNGCQLRETYVKAEDQKYRLIVAIATMFDSVCPFMVPDNIVAKILQAGVQDAKAC